jgi:hypothetical protein
MTLPPELQDYLHACDLTDLAARAEGHFPFAELEEATRSGEASSDLVDWLQVEYQRSLEFEEWSGQSPPPHARSHARHPAGTRMDRPPMGDEKNYQQGPPNAEGEESFVSN